MEGGFSPHPKAFPPRPSEKRENPPPIRAGQSVQTPFVPPLYRAPPEERDMSRLSRPLRGERPPRVIPLHTQPPRLLPQTVSGLGTWTPWTSSGRREGQSGPCWRRGSSWGSDSRRFTKSCIGSRRRGYSRTSPGKGGGWLKQSRQRLRGWIGSGRKSVHRRDGLLAKFGKQKGGDDIDQPPPMIPQIWGIKRGEVETALLLGSRAPGNRGFGHPAGFGHDVTDGELRKAPW